MDSMRACRIDSGLNSDAYGFAAVSQLLLLPLLKTLYNE
jgi:hypothetical protein